MIRSHSILLIGGIFMFALGCGSDQRTTEEPIATSEPTSTEPTSTAPDTAATTAPTAQEPQLPPVELVAGTPAEAPPKAPTIAIKAPTANQVIPADKAGDFEVKLDLKGWDVPAGGNHVHLILDGRPYKRIDDAKAPIKLKDLDPSYTLSEGQHVLVAFPSRSTHESVKPIGKAVPLAVTSFFVGKKGEATWKPTDPTLVYSRPKGANDGPPPSEGILVDFYLANVELGDGKHSVEATLTGPGAEQGVKASIKSWGPWRIKNPRDGAYKLRLALLDKDGKPVPGAWNDTTRDFTVNSKAPPPADHAHAPEPPAGEKKAEPAKKPEPAPKK
ncbi:MAG: hypothetical protein HOW73_34240 [Polyangiaceae bacterium]|nr:hypothetical protein [Polyangiaceae bacterium]